MTVATLAGPADIDGFRDTARRLLGRGVAPESVHWTVDGEDTLPWDLDDAATVSAARAEPFKVPAGFIALCETTLLHRDPQRFALMYRLLWRLRHAPGFWCDELDPERRRAEQLAREVRRDIHKMRAFVRFTPVVDAAGERHIAWFEPAFHIVEANAAFFLRRFAQMRWAILTPDRSVAWDGERLAFGPGAHRRDAPPPDAGAALWLTYYEHIFNPARLKLDAMVKEMPRRYWVNLPEAALIAPLTAAATARSEAMVAAEATAPRRTKPIALPRRGVKPAA